ncbi:hypothetical protein [Rhodococcus sp. NPDC058521]|uniref:hypothetical protein n=1 Tax=Rhodococcus sp. NPDC058521 TaxID=3346536 RepID=UPI003667787F
MRVLFVLLAGFGFALGLLVSAALLIWSSDTSTPRRVNYAFVGADDSGTSFEFPSGVLLAAPLIGALLGLVLAAGLSRFGWQLIRKQS